MKSWNPRNFPDKQNFVKLSTLLIKKGSHKRYATLTTPAVVWALWSFKIFIWSELYWWILKERNSCCLQIDPIYNISLITPALNLDILLLFSIIRKQSHIKYQDRLTYPKVHWKFQKIIHIEIWNQIKSNWKIKFWNLGKCTDCSWKIYLRKISFGVFLFINLPSISSLVILCTLCLQKRVRYY